MGFDAKNYLTNLVIVVTVLGVSLFTVMLLMQARTGFRPDKEDNTIHLSQLIPDEKVQKYLWSIAAQYYFYTDELIVSGVATEEDLAESMLPMQTVYGCPEDIIHQITSSFSEDDKTQTLEWKDGTIVNFVLVEILDENGDSTGTFDSQIEVLFPDETRIDGDILETLQYSLANNEYVQVTVKGDQVILNPSPKFNKSLTSESKVINDGIITEFLKKLSDYNSTITSNLETEQDLVQPSVEESEVME